MVFFNRNVNRSMGVFVSVLTLTVGVCSAAFAGATWASATEADVALQSVTMHRLAEDGISLGVPKSAPTVSGNDAHATALQSFPGSQVRERVLALVTDDRVQPAIKRLCWGVSIVPPQGIWSSNHQVQGTYDLLFIDATSGKYFFGTKGGT